MTKEMAESAMVRECSKAWAERIRKHPLPEGLSLNQTVAELVRFQNGFDAGWAAAGGEVVLPKWPK